MLTATGPISGATTALQTLIANLAWFQTWVGAGDAAEALPYIYIGEVGFPILSVTISAGTITIQTRETHNVQAAQQIELRGASLGAEASINLDGVYTVASVTSDTIVITGSAQPDLPATYADLAWVLPTPPPFVVIGVGDDAINSKAIGTGGASVFSGSIDVLLEASVSAEYQNDPLNARIEADNALGSFIQSLMQAQDGPDFAGGVACMTLNGSPRIHGVEFVAMAEQNDNTVRYERWRAMVTVSWGLDG